MGFLSSLFGSAQSTKPEDYTKIFFRWSKDGQEYGPSTFESLLNNKWKNSPKEGRFANDFKWKRFSYFLNLVNTLQASEDQIATLKELNANFDEGKIKYTEANTLIKFQKKIKTEKEAIEKKEKQLLRKKEREEKEKLPATKQSLKKLDALGIEYSGNITRGGVQELICEYDEKEEIKELFKRYKELGVELNEKINFEEENEDSTIIPDLDDLLNSLVELKKFDVTYDFPDRLDPIAIEDITDRITDALFEAEDAEEQVKEREICVGDNEYKIVGKLPKKNFKDFNKEVITKCLNREWDFEQNVLEMLAIYFPDTRLKEIEY